LGTSTLVSRWIVITLAASIVSAVDGGFVAQWAALAPARVWHGELWRLVTWPFVEPGPVSLVVTCLSIFKFGSELSVRWGDRRLLRFVGQIVLAAGVTTCVLYALAGGGYFARLGGWAVCDVLVIAWARQFPLRPLVIYNLVAFRGRELVLATLGIAILFGLYYGPLAMAPELVACACAAMYPRSLLYR
jgi:membrane associated rhomboid family serine protease